MFVGRKFTKLCSLSCAFLYYALILFQTYKHEDDECVNLCEPLADILLATLQTHNELNLDCCIKVAKMANSMSVRNDYYKKTLNLIHDGYTVQMWIMFDNRAAMMNNNRSSYFKLIIGTDADRILVEIVTNSAVEEAAAHISALATISYIHKLYNITSTLVTKFEISFDENKWTMITVLVDRIQRSIRLYKNGVAIDDNQATGFMLKFDESFEKIKSKNFKYEHVTLNLMQARLVGLHHKIGCLHPSLYAYQQIVPEALTHISYNNAVLLILFVFPPNFWISTETIMSLNEAFKAVNLQEKFVIICANYAKKLDYLETHLRMLANFPFFVLINCQANETQYSIAAVKNIWSNHIFKYTSTFVVLLDASLVPAPLWLLNLVQYASTHPGNIFYSKQISSSYRELSGKCIVQKMMVRNRLILGVASTPNLDDHVADTNGKHKCIFLGAVLIKDFFQTKHSEFSLGSFYSSFYSHIFLIAKHIVLIHDSVVIRHRLSYPSKSRDSLWHLYHIHYEQVFAVNTSLHNQGFQIAPITILWHLKAIDICSQLFSDVIESIINVEQLLFMDATLGIYFDGDIETRCSRVDVHALDDLRRLMIIRGSEVHIAVTDIFEKLNENFQNRTNIYEVQTYKIVRYMVSNCDIFLNNSHAKIADELWLKRIDCIKIVQRSNPKAKIVIFKSNQPTRIQYFSTETKKIMIVFILFRSARLCKLAITTAVTLCRSYLNGRAHIKVMLLRQFQETCKKLKFFMFEEVRNCIVSFNEVKDIKKEVTNDIHSMVIASTDAEDVVEQVLAFAFQNVTYVLPLEFIHRSSHCCRLGNCYHYYTDRGTIVFSRIINAVTEALTRMRFQYENATNKVTIKEKMTKQFYSRFAKVLKSRIIMLRNNKNTVFKSSTCHEKSSTVNGNGTLPKHLKVAFFSSFRPTKCAVGEFTENIIKYGFSKMQIPKMSVKIFALIDDTKENASSHIISEEVRWIIKKSSLDDIITATRIVREENFDLVIIQHAFLLFGNDNNVFKPFSGSFALDLLSGVKPVRTLSILHTAMLQISDDLKNTIKMVVDLSDVSVVMAPSMKTVLCAYPSLNCKKVFLVPMPTFEASFVDAAALNYSDERFRFSSRKLILSIGLIAPHKKIEHVISVIKLLRQKFQEVLFLIIGGPHYLCGTTCIDYYAALKSLTKVENLTHHVIFLQEYISTETVVALMKASTAFMANFNAEPNGFSTSVALALAVQSLPIIVTPFSYARDVLSDHRGIFIKFDDEMSLFDALYNLLEFGPTKRNTVPTKIIKWKAMAFKLLEVSTYNWRLQNDSQSVAAFPLKLT